MKNLPMLAAVLMLLAAGASTAADAPRMLADLTTHGEFTNYSLSSDGRTLALLEPGPAGSKIEILPTDGGASAEVSVGGYTVGDVNWIDSDHLAVTTRFMIDGNEAMPRQMVTQFLSYDRRTGKVATLLAGTDGVLPFASGGPVVYGRYEERPVAFMRGMARNLRFPLMAADATTGLGTKVDFGSFDVEAYAVTPEGRIVAVQMLDANSRRSWLSFRTGGAGRDVHPAADMQPFSLFGLGRGLDTVLIAQNGRLIEVASTGQADVLASGGSRAIFNRRTGLLEAVHPATFTDAITIYDDGFGAKWKAVQAVFPGQKVQFIDADDDNDRFLVTAGRSAEDDHFYWVDLAAGVVRGVRNGAPPAPASSELIPHEFQFKARDGGTLRAEVTIPAGASHPVPAVVWVAEFGSPGKRPVSGMLKMLTKRGYAVLLLSPPELGGGGASSRPADRGRIDGPFQTDVQDAVAHLAAERTIDPSRVCIGGAGYGGYVAMMAVTTPGGAYRCAVAVDPIIDLGSVTTFPQVETRSDAWNTVPKWRAFVGADNLTGARLRALSPASRAESASAPVLLIDGTVESDPTYRQAQIMARALKGAGKPVSLVEVPRRADEGEMSEGSPGAVAVMDFVSANDR